MTFRHEATQCGPQSHIHFNSISWVNEIIKPDCTVLRSLDRLIDCGCYYVGSYSQNSVGKSIKLPQFCFMRPTWLTGVWPAVDLSWKALIYVMFVQVIFLACNRDAYILGSRFWRNTVGFCKLLNQGLTYIIIRFFALTCIAYVIVYNQCS